MIEYVQIKKNKKEKKFTPTYIIVNTKAGYNCLTGKKGGGQKYNA